MPIVWKSGSLNLLEFSGPVQALNGMAFFGYDGSTNMIIPIADKCAFSPVPRNPLQKFHWKSKPRNFHARDKNCSSL